MYIIPLFIHMIAVPLLIGVIAILLIIGAIAVWNAWCDGVVAGYGFSMYGAGKNPNYDHAGEFLRHCFPDLFADDLIYFGVESLRSGSSEEGFEWEDTRLMPR